MLPLRCGKVPRQRGISGPATPANGGDHGMKQLGILALVGLFAVGCPIYDSAGCFDRDDCAPGFACDVVSGYCVDLGSQDLRCERPRDCRSGETCTELGECRPGSCFIHGCVTGYRCDIVGGVHECISGSDGADAASDAGGDGPMDASMDATAGEPTTDAAPDATTGDAATQDVGDAG